MARDLDTLTDQLFALIDDEDLNEEQLKDASEGLLPQLADALLAEGYGTPGDDEASD